MKHSKIRKLAISLISMCIAMPLAVHFSSSNHNKVSAETSNVYDYSKCKNIIPNGYYDSLDMNSSKDAFSDKLCSIISANNTFSSYDNVGKITLHNSDMDPNNPDNVLCLYTGQSLRGGWNREHVWCKSHGFSEKNTYDPYKDAHHLRVTNSTANSKRNNSDYGEVDHTTAYKDVFGNYYTGDTYEPRDEIKGDCARMIFYFAIRYRNASPYNAKIIEGSSLSYLSTYGQAVFGNLSTLLKWHYQDPVSVNEIYRNNVVYEYQNNRNPFIDHPEYVEKCFETSKKVDTSIREDKIGNMLDAIRAIPEVVSLEDESTVMNAYNKYDKELNNNERSYLSDSSYSVLMNAVKTIRALNLQKENNKSTKTTYFETSTYKDASGNTQNFSTSKYYSSYTIGYNYGDIYLSNFHWEKACNAYQVSLGKNSSSLLPQKYNFSKYSYGDYFETQYEYQDITSISVFCPAPKRDISNFYGYGIFINDGGNLELLKYDTEFTTNVSVSFNEPKSGKVGFVIFGSSVAVCIQSMTIIEEIKNDECVSYLNTLDTKASLHYEKGNNSTIKNIKIKFGALISYSTISSISNHHKITEYGIFAGNFDSSNKSISSSIDTNKSIEENKNELKNKGINCTSSSVYQRTSDQGRTTNSNGEQIVFSAEINVSKDSKNVIFNAVSYLVIDDKIVLLKEREESLSSLINKYLSRGASGALLNDLEQLLA